MSLQCCKAMFTNLSLHCWCKPYSNCVHLKETVLKHHLSINKKRISMTQYLLLGIYGNKYKIHRFYSAIEGKAADIIFPVKCSLISFFSFNKLV